MTDKQPDLADPKIHYGSPIGATSSFIVQRLTGALNVLFLAFLVWFVVRLAGHDRAEMVAVVANPFVAIILVLLIGNVSHHMRIGMNEVIEDYVDAHAANRVARAANAIFAYGVAAVTIIAIAKIVFWG